MFEKPSKYCDRVKIRFPHKYLENKRSFLDFIDTLTYVSHGVRSGYDNLIFVHFVINHWCDVYTNETCSHCRFEMYR